ncbi:DUF3034 family protein [Zhongshania aquimaris]|uniref:DUF3034 family protein n=1 Tax=Zhongshania aquimaris TaxID=2857107 RepID=A0ABS6VVD5_9GAMM|nr:DUF3034 family protein [Zhongshania aquimaris]MBW2942304.1 DUF3034 family protein [Zhongshania aquimaris]|tara:strand:- start:72 stop:1121 length:1050 start_codon:yes stop_codon:yes gene_type:complete
MEEAKRAKFPVSKGAALVVAMLASGLSQAGWYDSGKVLATGGVSMIDGAGGGGITPWATITGYGTKEGINGDLHYTYAPLANYTLHSLGAAVGFWDRFELSYTSSALTTGSTFDTVGLVADTLGGVTGSLAGTPINTGIEPFNTTIEMESIGAKVRVFGEAIYDSDNLIPQIAIGGFYKNNKNEDLLKTLKADKAKDWEAYISATKIFFPINTLINITARYTAANQTGLVGFGGPDGSDKEIRPEISLAYLLRKDTVIGIEWAQHGDNLEGESVEIAGLDLTGLQPTLEALGLGNVSGTLTQHESDWYDVFVAFFPNKNLSITMAYAMLGNITITPDQHGFYMSLQASF